MRISQNEADYIKYWQEARERIYQEYSDSIGKGKMVTEKVENKKLKPADAVNEFMSRFRSIYSGHEDLALEVFRRITGHIMGIKEPNKPVGVYLSFGPSGSGKSFFWECIAETIHTKKDALLYLNGGEYSNAHESAKLIGAPPGYLGHRETEPVVTNKAMNHVRGESSIPINIVLFDEIDKAHRSVHTVFLGAMERAVVKSGDGSTINFSDALIAYTANSGDNIYDKKTFGIPGADHTQDSPARKMLMKDFSAAFLNRVDKMILFNAYSEEERMNAFRVQFKRMQESLGIYKNTVSVSDEFIREMARVPMTKEFGMRDVIRKMKNIVRDRCLSLALGEPGDSMLIGDDVKKMLEEEHGSVRAMHSAASKSS